MSETSHVQYLTTDPFNSDQDVCLCKTLAPLYTVAHICVKPVCGNAFLINQFHTKVFQKVEIFS